MGAGFECVRVLVESPRLAGRMAATFEAARRAELAPLGGVGTLPELEVLPWIDVDDDVTRASILQRDELARARSLGRPRCCAARCVAIKLAGQLAR